MKNKMGGTSGRHEYIRNTYIKVDRKPGLRTAGKMKTKLDC